MGSGRRGGIALLAIASLVLAAGIAGAGEARRIGLSLMVSHVSRQPGPVDPAGREVHRRLEREFPVGSLRVLENRRLNLRLDEVGGVRLPTGRWIRVRPLHLGPGGVLLAVDVENTLQTDLRVPNHHPVSIGVQRYHNGKLVVTLEPDY